MKRARKISAVLAAALAAVSIAACGNSAANETGVSAESTAVETTAETTESITSTATELESEPLPENEVNAETAADSVVAESVGNESAETQAAAAATQNTAADTKSTGGKVLVAYFSASGNTARVAEEIADAAGGDLFEIVPVEPYSDADLNWSDSGSRVSREHDDESLRDIPLTTTEVKDWSEYDTVFIGYPIWWGSAAWPVNNFVKNNDFSGKKVIPFATSASSGLGQSGEQLARLAGTGDWQEGRRFSGGASDSEVSEWVNGLGL